MMADGVSVSVVMTFCMCWWGRRAPNLLIRASLCIFFLRVSFQANVLGSLAESCRPPGAVGVVDEAAVASSEVVDFVVLLVGALRGVVFLQPIRAVIALVRLTAEGV